MTNKEAITTLKANYPDSCYEQLREAVNVAIKALEAQDAAGDTISRQTVFDALRTCYDTETVTMSNGDEYINYEDAVGEIEQLPPAQPETHEERTETHGVCLDTISRQDAIRIVDSIDTWQAGWRGDAIESLKALPSAQPEVLACGEGELIAQPEIIRCNDCKHWTQTTGNMRGFGLGDCDYINAKLVNCNGFCYWAERETDEKKNI